MALSFEWDDEKALRNHAKHDVTFDEAATVFGDPLSITIDDPAHSTIAEERSIIVGTSTKQRLLVVVFTEREYRMRIISARKATRIERKQYEEGIEKED